MTSKDDAILEEVSQVRTEWVDVYVVSRINNREGDASDDQVRDWQNEAYRIWREKHPALSQFLIGHRDPKAGA